MSLVRRVPAVVLMLACPRISCSILGRVSRLDHKRGGGVPQVVNAEPVTDARTLAERQEHALSPVRGTDDAARGCREHEIVGFQVRGAIGQFGGKESRQRHSAGVM